MLPLLSAPADSIPAVPTPRQEFEMLKTLPLDEIINKVVHSAVSFVTHLALAVIVFYLGRFIIRKLYKLVRTIMVRRRVDRSLTTFTLSLVQIVLYFILIVTVIGILGLETSSFLAIFASAGVAIGMALSGTLQNFAGGVLILLLKPYRIGDYIEAQGFAGTVKEIQIFHTIIVTYDNKAIIIPNGGLSTGSINNWSREDYRRVDWKISISYGDDVSTVREFILATLLADERVVKTTVEDHRAGKRPEYHITPIEDTPEPDDTPPPTFWQRLTHKRRRAIRAVIASPDLRIRPELLAPPVNREPQVVLSEMADSAIVITVRAWTRTSDYWSLFFEMNEKFYNELPRHGASFPFPQIVVHKGAPDA